jgi:hypothetical protein
MAPPQDIEGILFSIFPYNFRLAFQLTNKFVVFIDDSQQTKVFFFHPFQTGMNGFICFFNFLILLKNNLFIGIKLSYFILQIFDFLIFYASKAVSLEIYLSPHAAVEVDPFPQEFK